MNGFAKVRGLPGRRAALHRLASLKLALLDLVIALGRKLGGFCALLTLGWIYFRLLALGHSLRQIHPGAPDADLRQTLWVALLLIMAQGWDISTDQIAAHWNAVGAHWPTRAREPVSRALPRVIRGPWALTEPVVIRLGRFMDLCVAIANKLGAFAVLLYLLFLAEQFAFAGTSVRALYPDAADPTVSFLADLCVYVVVLGWWATPFEQIQLFWRQLRAPLAKRGGALPSET